MLRWQMDHQAFLFEAEALRAMLRLPPNAPQQLNDGTPLTPFLEQLVAQFIEMKKGDRDAALNFCVMFYHLYNAGTATTGLGPQYTYRISAQVFAGHSQTALAEVVLQVPEHEARHFGEERTWHKPDPSLLGPDQAHYRTGLKSSIEIIELMKALKAANITPDIVTASVESIVAVAAPALGYPVAREHICGVRLQEQEGRFTENLIPDYPQPIAEGKSELIRSLLPRQPILVAGDSANDLPMLTAFENTQVRLLLHRPGKGLDALYGDALMDETPQDHPVTVLQGRDANTGTFNPASVAP